MSLFPFCVFLRFCWPSPFLFVIAHALRALPLPSTTMALRLRVSPHSPAAVSTLRAALVLLMFRSGKAYEESGARISGSSLCTI